MTAGDDGIRALIEEFAHCGDEYAQRNFILSHPVMISDRFGLAMGYSTPTIRAAYLKAVEEVGGIVRSVGQPPGESISVSFNARYPVGSGPIEAIWSQLESRSISLEIAIQRVCSPQIGSLLTFVYVHALRSHCRELSSAGHQSLALDRQRLIVEAAEATVHAIALTSDDDLWQLRFAAAHGWIDQCSATLLEIADPRLLRHATGVGERLLQLACRRRDISGEARLRQRLGVLFLDPYIFGRNTSNRHNYERSLRLWQERLRDHLGREFEGLAKADRFMPPVREALARAEAYLRASMAMSTGPEKGDTIAALLQALLAQQCLGKRIDVAEAIGLARNGIALLADSNNLERHIRLSSQLSTLLGQQNRGGSATRGVIPWLMGLLEIHKKTDNPSARRDVSANRDTIERFLSMPIDQLQQELGPIVLLDAVRALGNELLRDGRDVIGLQLIARFRTLLFDAAQPEGFREDLWHMELKLLRSWCSSGAASQGHTQEADTEAEIHWQRVAENLATALNSSDGNREADGLRALDEAIALDCTLLQSHAEALTWLRAVLLRGEGTNRFNGTNHLFKSRDCRGAVTFYVDAMVLLAQLRLSNAVLECLDRLQKVIDEGDYGAMFSAIHRLQTVTPDIEALVGGSGRQRLQSIYRCASAYWRSQSGDLAVDESTIFRTLRLAKGHWFAGALHAPTRFDWRMDADALRQLDAITHLAAELGLSAAGGGSGDESRAEDMLIGEAGTHELRPGSNDEQRYENLRLAFDDYVKRRYSEGLRASKTVPETPSLVTFQATLDARTVVLDYFLGVDNARRSTLYILAITNDEVTLSESPLAGLSDGQDVSANPIGHLVRDIRTGVSSMPGFGRVVRRQAEAALTAGEEVFLGPVTPFLAAQLARGRDHLVVIPHGPLHFLPLHLLGPVEAPIAQDWVVTYLPVVSMLRPRKARPSVPPSIRLTSIGLDFCDGTRPGIPPIRGAPEFVRDLAKSAGGRALVNGDATATKVGEALQSSRYVHLYTHGQQCIYAAAFHALYVAPDPQACEDGVLRAYQILPFDCGGIEVVTLSACESALGRFDSGDNLTGLPGSLFLAGAQRIIGTLWPVGADVAELFFKRFYKALHGGADMLVAFRDAQLAAREKHREYRDWGAFYFTGSCSSDEA